MGRNFEKEFFEQFESLPVKGKPSDPLSELFDADQEQDGFAELSELILRFQDGEIDKKQFKRLQDWILYDSRAMDYYVKYGYLCAGLNILLNKKQNLTFLNHPLTV